MWKFPASAMPKVGRRSDKCPEGSSSWEFHSKGREWNWQSPCDDVSDILLSMSSSMSSILLASSTHADHTTVAGYTFDWKFFKCAVRYVHVLIQCVIVQIQDVKVRTHYSLHQHHDWQCWLTGDVMWRTYVYTGSASLVASECCRLWRRDLVPCSPPTLVASSTEPPPSTSCTLFHPPTLVDPVFVCSPPPNPCIASPTISPPCSLFPSLVASPTIPPLFPVPPPPL